MPKEKPSRSYQLARIADVLASTNAQSRIKSKSSWLDSDLFADLLKRLPICLSAKHDFTGYVEQNNLEEELKQWVAARNKLTVTYAL